MRLVLSLSLCLVAMSCLTNGGGQNQVSAKKAQLKRVLDPLLGKSQKEVVLTIGEPTGESEVVGLKVWEYYHSYGRRGMASTAGNGYAYGYGVVSANANTVSDQWESFDYVRLYFEKGVLIKWDANIQR